MTYTTRIIRGDNVYLYRVTSYRDHDTGKVKQKAEYLGKEVLRGSGKIIQKPGTGSLSGKCWNQRHRSCTGMSRILA